MKSVADVFNPIYIRQCKWMTKDNPLTLDCDNKASRVPVIPTGCHTGVVPWRRLPPGVKHGQSSGSLDPEID